VKRSLLIGACIITFITRYAFAAPKEAGIRGEGCLACHKGIETINEKMAKAWGADRKCEICHSGNPAGATELEAHAGLIANPGDLRVIERTCGRCHSDYGEIQNIKVNGIDNHAGRVNRSIMATAAGEIAGTRYLWNEQVTRTARYGIRDVSDLDRRQPPGAVNALQQLPPPAQSDADHLLRSTCLRCHLWTEDKSTPGTYRPAGCSACHVLYDSSGLSRSSDSSITKNEPGHPVKHEITTAIPTSQCLLCHNDGGARIGLSYVGLSVTDATIEPKAGALGDEVVFGAHVVHVPPDVHFRVGMDCIDCHNTVDVHGDGNLYSRRETGVGIRCETCHGTASKPPTFRTERGEPLENINVQEGKPYLLTKIFMEKHSIPVINSTSVTPLSDIWHKGHQRLECYACHSAAAPQCYVCHMVRDDSKTSAVDWAQGIGENQPAQKMAGGWSGRKLLEQWFDPVLGINSRGRISPFIPGGQPVVSRFDSSGVPLALNRTFTTAGGLYGFSLNPVQPHTVTSGSRTCSSCHSSTKALGLGTTGWIDLKRHGLPMDFPPDSIGDDEGTRIQDSPHEGARPFSNEELKKIYRTGSCEGCHKEPVDRVNKPESPPSVKDADQMHQKLIELLVSPKDE
jgi:hypothetical protein